MQRIVILFVVLALSHFALATEYHVSVKGSDQNPGTMEKPFRTIAKAVEYAYPGDVITVHEGTYRERVDPIRGGKSDSERIVFRAAPGEKVIIKGSEVISGWKREKGNVWKVSIPNSFFGDYNPYKDLIFGDWFFDRDRIHHTGEVFLNEKSLYEKETLDKVLNPIADTKMIDPEGSTYTWYCESDEGTTTIWANFHRFDPNKELVEISTRNTCFYPTEPGIDYITISGFHLSQAATQWGAPTAEQVGLIATHWNKGWIIENNVVSNSKCSGITLGKDRNTGHNVWSNDIGSINNDGNIHYIEVVFRTLEQGWNKDNIGSHMVRNNEIFDCGQAGISGSMGAAFSTIESNHIHHIYTKRQYGGAEMGGIKFHAAIDAVIRNNRIHNTDIGIWLDWMTQGTRVSGNLFYDNDLQDLFLEVNHGPFIVDNNIFLSPNAISTQSEGGAFVHNLIAGALQVRSDLGRFTPYHYPHSTAIKGLSTIRSGDDRYYNNIFVENANSNRSNPTTLGYQNYKNTEFPVYVDGNIYLNGAVHYDKEQNYFEEQGFDPKIALMDKGGKLHLQMDWSGVRPIDTQLITTDLLGMAIIPKQAFENSDGSPLRIDTDYFGRPRDKDNPTPGPFEEWERGTSRIKVW